MNDITVYQLSAIAVLFVITACLSYIARKMPSKSKRRVAPINQPVIPLEPSTSQIGNAKEAFVEEGENSTQAVENWQTTTAVNQGYKPTAGIDECGIIDATITGLPGAVNDEMDGCDSMMICGNEEGKFRSQSSQSSPTDDQVSTKNAATGTSSDDESISAVSPQEVPVNESEAEDKENSCGKTIPVIGNTDEEVNVSTKKDEVFQQEQNIPVVPLNQPPYDPHASGYGYIPVPVTNEVQQAQTVNSDEYHVNNVVTNPEHENNNNQPVIDTIEINDETNIDKEAVEDEQMQTDSDKLQYVDAESSHELTKEIVPEDTNMADAITDVEMMAKLKIHSNSTDNLNANNDRNSPDTTTSSRENISAVSSQETPVNESEAEDRDENSCEKTMPIIGKTDEEVNANQTVLENHVVDVTADSNIETRSNSVEVNETQEIDQTSAHHQTTLPLENEPENSRKHEDSTEDDECTTKDTSQSDNVD